MASRLCVLRTVEIVALGTLVLAGCSTVDPPSGEIGLTGFVGVEVVPELVGGIPTLTPVAVLLAPEATGATNVRPLTGATVELWVSGTRLAQTSTDAAGIWSLPKRVEERVGLSALTPTGLFDTLAPAPIVTREQVALADEGPVAWPATARRIPRDQIVEDISITIEGARDR